MTLESVLSEPGLPFALGTPTLPPLEPLVVMLVVDERREHILDVRTDSLTNLALLMQLRGTHSNPME
jgi:hypothetical protein